MVHQFSILRILVPAVVTGLLTGSVGCGKFPPGARAQQESDTDAQQEEQATPVVVGTIRSGEILASIGAASTIEAERQVTVHAESTGRLVSLSVEEGDKVRKGALLARVKADSQAVGLDRASASLEKARADLATVESLYAKKVASKEELDSARLTLKTSTLDVRDRRRDIRNTKVTAPFSGTITERFVTAGGFVSSGAQLLTITDFDTLVARVYVPEKELDRIRVGQPAKIVGKAARGRSGTGTVQRISPVVDSATGTFKVTVGLPPPKLDDKQSLGFLPGMYAEVTLTTDHHKDVVLVPKQALVFDDDQAFVFVADDDRAKRVRLTIGLQDSDHAEVLSGLDVGAEVVVSGQAGLKDQSLIRRVDEAGNDVEAAAVEGEGIAERGTAANADSVKAGGA